MQVDIAANSCTMIADWTRIKNMQSKSEIKISCIIVTNRRLNYLKAFLQSLSNSILIAPRSLEFQIILVINGDDTDTLEYLKELKLPFTIKIIEINNPVSPAEARNRALPYALFDWLCFFDDDIVLPENYFINFEKLSDSANAFDILGGPNLTPPNSSHLEKIIGFYLENLLVCGPMSLRYKFNKFQKISEYGFRLSLCNLFVKKSSFSKFKFDSIMRTAEENDLFYKIKTANGKFLFSNSLYVWHGRRSSISLFLRQINNYGYGRGQLLKSHKNLLSAWLIAFIIFLVLGYLFFTTLVALYFFSILIVFIQGKLKFWANYKAAYLIIPTQILITYFSGIIKSFLKND